MFRQDSTLLGVGGIEHGRKRDSLGLVEAGIGEPKPTPPSAHPATVHPDNDFGTPDRASPTTYNRQEYLAWRGKGEDRMDPVIASGIFGFGLLFGSFLNVCIYRLPRGLSVVWPGSACPHCEKPIAFCDNIPVLSWLILRGRCRNCKASVTPRYLIVEIITGLLFLACYAEFGLTLATLKCAVFGFLLLGLIFTDAETHLLPDKMTLPGLCFGLLISFFVPVNDLLSLLLPGSIDLPVSSDISWRVFSFLDAALGALIGASFLYGIGAAYYRLRHVEGMGFGDVKLMAMMGAFLGFRLTILTMMTASLAGSAFGLWTVLVVWIKRTQRRKRLFHEPAATARKHAWGSAVVALRRHQMPFGVFLGSMGLLAFFFGPQFIHWYWRLM